MSKDIVFFELNEVPWRIITDFVQSHPESTLAKLLPLSSQYETYATDNELSPWTTWSSLHRGVDDEKHHISNFGQELDEVNHEFPQIWQILANRGVKVGVFGSLHSYPLPKSIDSYEFFVPDVFAAGKECFPTHLEYFQDFNLSMSRKSERSVSSKLPIEATAKFLTHLPELGIRPSTMLEVGSHLISERIQNWKKVRRRTYQVVLAFDLFMKQLKATRPQFCTFFTNHVASTMHRYWAARYPEDYDDFGYPSDWVSRYKYEIFWTLSKFDSMLNKLKDFVDRNPTYELWITSSMGQEATSASTMAKTQLQIEDPNKFINYFGFSENEYSIRPAMLPRRIVSLNDAQRAQDLFEKTKDISIEHKPLIVKNLGNGVLQFKPPILFNGKDQECLIQGKVHSLNDLGLKHVPIDDSSSQTAYHIPNGSLFVYPRSAERTKQSERTQISNCEIAPALLRNFEISVPDYMTRTKSRI